jgi:hypothetical protein
MSPFVAGAAHDGVHPAVIGLPTTRGAPTTIANVLANEPSRVKARGMWR